MITIHEKTLCPYCGNEILAEIELKNGGTFNQKIYCGNLDGTDNDNACQRDFIINGRVQIADFKYYLEVSMPKWDFNKKMFVPDSSYRQNDTGAE